MNFQYDDIESVLIEGQQRFEFVIDADLALVGGGSSVADY